MSESGKPTIEKMQLLLKQEGVTGGIVEESAKKAKEVLGERKEIKLLRDYATILFELREFNLNGIGALDQTTIRKKNQRIGKLNERRLEIKNAIENIEIRAKEKAEDDTGFNASKDLLDNIEFVFRDEDDERVYNYYLSELIDTLICMAIYDPEKGPHLANFAKSLINIRFKKDFEPEQKLAKEDIEIKLKKLEDMHQEHKKYKDIAKEISSLLDTTERLKIDEQFDFASHTLLEAQRLCENAQESLPIFGNLLQAYLNEINSEILELPTIKNNKTY